MPGFLFLLIIEIVVMSTAGDISIFNLNFTMVNTPLPPLKRGTSSDTKKIAASFLLAMIHTNGNGIKLCGVKKIINEALKSIRCLSAASSDGLAESHNY